MANYTTRKCPLKRGVPWSRGSPEKRLYCIIFRGMYVIICWLLYEYIIYVLTLTMAIFCVFLQGCHRPSGWQTSGAQKDAQCLPEPDILQACLPGTTDAMSLQTRQCEFNCLRLCFPAQFLYYMITYIIIFPSWDFSRGSVCRCCLFEFSLNAYLSRVWVQTRWLGLINEFSSRDCTIYHDIDILRGTYGAFVIG